MNEGSPVDLHPDGVSLAALRRVGDGAAVRLGAEAYANLDDAAKSIARIVASGRTVYGVNTGFGLLANTRIDDEKLGQLQRNLVLSHACGVGDPFAARVVRIMMALKVVSLSRGRSGVRRDVVERIIDLLRAQALPVIPSQGSVGASGDLAPLAHLSAAMMGIGRIAIAGEVMPAAAALARLSLEPLVLGPKEGLALLNGTQASTAASLCALMDAETIFRTAIVTGALAVDALKGSDAPFDARIQMARGQQGQIDAAAAIRALLAGSAIRASHTDCERVQDPYSFRCQPQVMGACLDLLRHVHRSLLTEANGVTDNPLVFPDTDEALSGGNFHAQPVAFAADILTMALCETGSLAERRLAVLVDPKMSGLPAFLVRDGGLNSGFMIPQVTAAALVAENRSLAFPASVDSIPTSANQEDHVSMATGAARKAALVAGNAASIIGIELLAAVQAVDFHHPLASSPTLEAVRALVRARVAPLEGDRYLSDDLDAARDIVMSGAAAAPAGAALSTLAL